MCDNKDFCDEIMPSEDAKILYFNQYQIQNIDGCKINPQNSFTTKVSKHIPSGFSMSAISSFKSIDNKHDVYRSKDCMKKFYESLREHAIKIINLKKRMKLLAKEHQESYKNAKICYICKVKCVNK